MTGDNGLMARFEAIVARVQAAQPLERQSYAPKQSVAPAMADGMVDRPVESEQPKPGKDRPAAMTDAISADAPSLSPADGGAKAMEGDGFDIDKVNREYALVLLGGKAVVYREATQVEDSHRLLTLEAFSAYYANRFVEQRGADNKVRHLTLAKAWQQHPRRRTYDGVEFHPDVDGATKHGNYLNLWKGFAVTPAENPDARRYSIFRDHLLNNIADGNEQIFRWVFGFFAHMVQKPRERLGVALVLRGGQGVGKTIIGDVFGARLLGSHYCLVDDARYLTGNFNAHMATLLFCRPTKPCGPAIRWPRAA
jgi:hypothetical protein